MQDQISRRFNFKQQRRFYYQKINVLVKSKRAGAFTMTILSIFAVSFFGMFAIRPTITTIVELTKQIDDGKKVNESLQNKIDSLVVAQEEYQLIKDFIPAINQSLPNQPNIIEALQSIETLALEKQASIDGLQVQTIEFVMKNENQQPDQNATNQNPQDMITNSTSEPSSIDINMILSGDYSQLYSFLDKLLKIRRLVTAYSLQLAPSGSTQEGVLKLNLSLNSYYLK